MDQTNDKKHETDIEGFLFWKGETVSITEISKLLDLPREGVLRALDTLGTTLKDRGVRLLRTDETVELRSTPELSPLIERLTKEELDKDLGKAGLETLSIVLYEGPVTRREIDYIRGVNSQFILRALLVRGLVERVETSDRRSFAYKPTTELLAHLGVSTAADLPEYTTHREKIRALSERASADKDRSAGQSTFEKDTSLENTRTESDTHTPEMPA